MLQKAVTIASLTALSIVAVSPAFAGETTNPQYGGTTPSVNVTIDKYVSDPNSVAKTETKGGTVDVKKEDYVYLDNITAADTDKRYSPTQKIAFKLTVKNTSDTSIKNVTVTDRVPVDTVSNITVENGSFDAEKKMITIKIDELKANESRDFYITGTIVGTDRLPSEQPVICDVNRSYVYVQGKSDPVDESNAGYCIEKETGKTTKGGKPIHSAPEVEKTPPTGPAALALIPILGSGIAGFILRSKSR